MSHFFKLYQYMTTERHCTNTDIVNACEFDFALIGIPQGKLPYFDVQCI